MVAQQITTIQKAQQQRVSIGHPRGMALPPSPGVLRLKGFYSQFQTPPPYLSLW